MEILKQTITYAVITLVKDYCKFPHESDVLEPVPVSVSDDFDSIFRIGDELPILNQSLSPRYAYIQMFKHEKGAKTKYFYINEELENGQKSLRLPFELGLRS